LGFGNEALGILDAIGDCEVTQIPKVALIVKMLHIRRKITAIPGYLSLKNRYL